MSKSTDWAEYYRRRGFISNITSTLAFRNFMHILRPHLQAPATHSESDTSQAVQPNLAIMELGGGNSIFYPNLRAAFPGSQLYLADKCLPTPDFAARTAHDSLLCYLEVDLLENSPELRTLHGLSNLVFSFGLIEHFSVAETRQMIRRHFDLACPGGLVFLSFPTPSLPYRLTRGGMELCNAWGFHDERPLSYDEVSAAAETQGIELHRGFCLRLGLSQGTLLYRKHGANESQNTSKHR